MKQRFTSLDVKVIAHELSNTITSLRVANVYDLSSRIFLFKLAKPGQRQQLLIDTGFHCQLTSFTRTTASAPSVFVSRLRKYLKSRRLTAVRQIGTDRIIDFEFSDGSYHMYYEFFASGNIILTDKESNILAIWRVVTAEGQQEELRQGTKYTVTNKQNYGGIPPFSEDRVKTALQTAVQREASGDASGKKKSKKKAADALRQSLFAEFPEFPPPVLEHAFKAVGLDSTLKPGQVLQDEALFVKTIKVFEVAAEVNENLLTNTIAKGYIIANELEPAPPGTEASAEPADDLNKDESKARLQYIDFHPFRPLQFDKQGVQIIEIDGYNKTVDHFFSSMESQKLESRLTEREEHAKRKLENARNEHERRVGALQQVQELHIRKAQAIEANLHRVEEASNAVNGLIAQGMDWVEMGRLIEMEQSTGNAVAQIIKLPLKLHENTVTLLLGSASAEDEDDEEEDPYETDSDAEESGSEDDEKAKKSTSSQAADDRLAIDIDLALSPWANARQYYEQMKTAAEKEQKTLESSEQALKNTERKITADLQKGLKNEKPTLKAARQQFWFEKFTFFISSDGYLVIGGKDAQQSEILYIRYLQKGDVYVSADVANSTSVIVKNNPSTPDAPIPISTLAQAGQLSIATSSAWDSKAVMPAWWVNAGQVSKTASTGEYLKAGGFNITGRKNYLPPAQLLLGFAVAFQVSEESKAKHYKHRIQAGQGSTTAPPVVANTTEDQAIENAEPAVPGSNDDDANISDNGDDDVTESESDDEKPDNRSNPLQSNSINPTTEVDADDESSDEDEQANDAELAEATQELKIKDQEDSVLQDGGEPEGEEEHEASSQPGKPESITDKRTATGARHLSAKERRLLKKGLPLDAVKEIASSNASGRSSPAPSTTSAPTLAPPTSKSTQQPVRGKRSKAKKAAAAKYADLSDSDREIAKRLVGASTTQQEKAAAAATAKEEREAYLAAQKERRREQHNKAAAAERDRQARLAQDATADLSSGMTEAEKEEMALLDTLVGTPMAGDEIMAAIPLCAPWTALAKYKYKAKLQPGTQKKGKAVKEIIAKWNAGMSEKKYIDVKSEDREKIWPREVELVKAWRIEEMMNIIPVGKVRVVMSGGTSGGGGAGGDAKGKGGKGKGSGKGGKGGKKGGR